MNGIEIALAVTSSIGVVFAIVNLWSALTIMRSLHRAGVNGLAGLMSRWNVEGAMAWLVVQLGLLLLSWRQFVLVDPVRVWPDSYIVWPPYSVDQLLVLSIVITLWMARSMILRHAAYRLARRDG